MSGLIRNFFSAVVLTGLSLLFSTPAFSQAALLPNAQQQFFDANGNPLTNGKVYMTVPNTAQAKTTWKDSTQTQNNTYPIQLDAGGWATIYGQGNYNQRVVAANGDQIWSKPTTAYGSSVPTGATGTDTAPVGTVVPFSGTSVPINWQLAYGQTVNRADFPELLAALTITNNSTGCVSGSPTLSGLATTTQIRIGAPIEASCVAPGTTVINIVSGTQITVSNNAAATATVISTVFPWGNGNGTSTMTLPDLRGRVAAGPDAMGGTASNRLQVSTTISTTSGSPTATVTSASNIAIGMVVTSANVPVGTTVTNLVGTTVTLSGNASATASGTAVTFASFQSAGQLASSGGSNAHAQTVAELVNHNHTLTDPGHTHQSAASSVAASTVTATAGAGQGALGGFATASATTGITLAATGGSNLSTLVQPTVVLYYIIKMKPNTTGAGGVVSIGGMFGDVICGASFLCASQTIGLATQLTGTVLANVSGVTATPSAATLTQWMDNVCGAAQGDIVYRSASTWTCLPPGTNGQALITQGAAANPAWNTLVVPITIGTTTITGGTDKFILYQNGASPGGTVGQYSVSGTGATVALTASPIFTVAMQASNVSIGAGSAVTSSGPGGALTALAYTAPGTGVATALGINVGSAGAFITFNGAGGTPSSMTATNLTGTAAGLTTGHVTTNANLTGPIASVGNATSITAQTGTGTTFVMNTNPSVAGLTVTGSFAATGLVTNADLASPTITINTVPCTLGSTCTISQILTVGASTIASGTDKFILYQNGASPTGTIGQYSITGTGTTVVMAAGPTLSGTVTLPDSSTWTSSGLSSMNVVPSGIINWGGTSMGFTGGGSLGNTFLDLRSGTRTYIEVIDEITSSSKIEYRLNNVGVIGFTSADPGVSAIDTGFQRISSGVMALGNSTLGDKSGVLQLAGVKLASAATITGIDGVTIVNTAGVLSSTGSSPVGAAGGGLTGTYPNPGLVVASTSVSGAVKVDGSTITITGGVISSTGSLPTGAAGGDLSGTYPNPSVANAPLIASVAKSANYTTLSADLGHSIDVTTGSSADVTITLLSAATAGTGYLQTVTKIDSGTKKAIVSDGGAGSWLSAQGDTVTYRSNGTNWNVETSTIADLTNLFTSSGTWTKPPRARTLNIFLIAGGSSGGSGARRASGTASSGGQGGAGTPINYLYNVPSSTYSSTETVTVGASVSGGASVTVNDTDGNPGILGNPSSFSSGSTLLTTTTTGAAASGGKAGASATGGAVNGGRVNGQPPIANASGGAGTQVSQGAGTLQNYAAGNGSGQVVTTPATNNGAGGGGSANSVYGDTPGVGGIGSSKTNPTVGTGAMFDFGFRLPGSPGGGWANSDGTAGDGAAGTGCGGPGGGGGSSVNGNNSGAGGASAAGCVEIITRFNFLLHRDFTPASNDNLPMFLNAAA